MNDKQIFGGVIPPMPENDDAPFIPHLEGSLCPYNKTIAATEPYTGRVWAGDDTKRHDTCKGRFPSELPFRTPE